MWKMANILRSNAISKQLTVQDIVTTHTGTVNCMFVGFLILAVAIVACGIRAFSQARQ